MTVTINGTTGIVAPAFDGAVDAADLTGTVPSSTLSTYLDPQNRIINGAFDFWERLTTSTTANVYLADRWFNALTGGTVTQSRQIFTIGETIGTATPVFYLRQTVSGQSAAADYAITQQRIESVRSYAGHTITILGWARRSSSSGNMAVSVDQNFGTGGSPSAAVEGAGQTVTLTSSWTPFAITLSVPSISGKTLGANNNDYLALNFWTSAGSNYNARTNSLGIQTIGVDLWGIHIKQGTHTSAACDLYRKPDYATEQALCQRYYWRISGETSNGNFTRYGNGFISATNSFHGLMHPTVKMRAIPSISATNIAVWDGATVIGASAVQIGSDGCTASILHVTATISGGTAYRPAMLLAFNTPSSAMIFDAEL